jgi:endonuclease/exonuclease/phosphatase (EEP) superfamily protein YafD
VSAPRQDVSDHRPLVVDFSSGLCAGAVAE